MFNWKRLYTFNGGDGFYGGCTPPFAKFKILTFPYDIVRGDIIKVVGAIFFV